MSNRFRFLYWLFPSRAEWRTHARDFQLALLSGLCGAVVFPSYHFSTLAWIALVPYFYALTRVQGRILVWTTFFFGIPWYYLSLWWLNTLTIFNPFIPLGALALPVVLTVYFLLFAFPASWAFRRQQPWLASGTVALLWCAVEYLRSLGEIAFPWNLLGYTQGHGPMYYLINWAEVGGVFLVSFFVALGNASAAVLVRRLIHRPEGESPRRAAAPAIVAWLVPGCIIFLGWICGLGLDVNARREAEFRGKDQTTSTLNIAIIQPNVSQLDKWALGAPDTPDDLRRDIHMRTVRQAFDMVRSVGTQEQATSSAAATQLYVLPETAFLDAYFVYRTELHDALTSLAREMNADIFFGADAREPRTEYKKRLAAGFRELAPDVMPAVFQLPKFSYGKDDRGQVGLSEPGEMAAFNSAWQIKPESGLVNHVYHKIQLVPFGESAPILGHIPGFQDYVMTVGSFQAGLEQTTFETRGIKYGAMICFESSFGYLGCGLARGGSRMLVVLTNDAWYNPDYLKESGGIFGNLFRLPVLRTLASSGPTQHFQMSVFRAIETRLPVIRAANTGISAVIDSNGKPTQLQPWDTEGIIKASVSAPHHKPTSYAKKGDRFARFCLGVFALMFLLEFFLCRKTNRIQTAERGTL